MPEDYYQLLGVSRDCEHSEIKRAYRRLARRYHPDVCKDDGAEDRFKDISKAYSVLSDPEKRRSYDMYGEDGGNGRSAGGAADIFDLFNQVFGGSGGPFGGPGGQPHARGSDLGYEVTIDLEGVLEGYEADLEVTRQAECDDCGGSGAAPGSAPTTCEMCGGRGQVAQHRQTLLGVMATTSPCPRCDARGTIITDPCSSCNGQGVRRSTQTVLVAIPPGIEDGQRIRMAGHGDVPPGGGVPGDLLIQVRVQKDPRFTRRGRDLLMDLDLSFSQAALGDTVTVPTIDGETEVSIAAGAQTGETVELSEKGLPPLHGGRRGRQIINLRVLTPNDLDETQRALLMELAMERGESISPAEHAGLFDRIRRKVLGGEG